MIKTGIFFILCLMCTGLWSQKKSLPTNTSRSQNDLSCNCGFDVMRQSQKADSRFVAAEKRMNERMLSRSQRPDSLTGIVTLPVVFHVIGANPANMTDAMVANGLQNLNDGFSKAGIYSSSLGVDTRIRFCFAKKDPLGGVTNGITRTTYFFGDQLNPLIEDAKIKKVVSWDPSQYINIWVVDTIEYEIFPLYNCSRWVRLNSQGYATMPPVDAAIDGIVVKYLDLILIEQMGHYLGLYHTFEGFNCRNNNCALDGDMVCDTPPDNSVGNASSCSNPTNSCRTDTLSGFATDVPDQISNFMDNGNPGCRNMFTAGQAKRMRDIIDTLRPGLLVSKCNAPCTQNIIASFTQNIQYPVAGNTVNFTNTSVGAISYEWLVNGVSVATTANFSKIFTVAGTYQVTLKAINGTCFATASRNILVNCGVTARFYTDKRQIASKVPAFLDSIHFVNNSVNGVTYRWLMRNDKGMNEQVVSTAPSFTYTFLTPANYQVRLVAINGSCRDTSGLYPIPVEDPDPDGYVAFSKANCYQETKVKVSFYVCNNGFEVIPDNIPITFYDTNPLLPSANIIGTTFYTPDTVLGKCCSFLNTVLLDVGHKGLNSIYAAFNDNGTTHPLSLPNTPFGELSYNNNISYYQNFAFRVTASPPLSVLQLGDTVQLKATARPDTVLSYVWSTPVNLTCTNCQFPLLIADTTIVKTVKATSNLGCTDTASIVVQVPPYNDFTVNINDLQCAKADSLYINFTIANSFKRAQLLKTLSVSFYSGDPTTSGAVLLPPVFSLPATLNAKQATFTTMVKAPPATGKIYAVVNDSGRALPVTFPNTLLLEKLYTNNIDDTTYFTDSVKVQPADTTVLRKQSFPLTITSPIYDPATTLWSAGSGYTLSCTNCPNPVITVFNDAVVPLQTANRYGCILHGAAIVHVLPADMQLAINEVKCLTNYRVGVTFTICMNNNYDSVFAAIPVTFYDANPDSGVAHVLIPVFSTPAAVAGNCHTYTTQIISPATGKIFAVVNDKGDNMNIVPDNVYNETNLNNNIDDTSYIPFSVSIIPSDTSIPRLGNIQLFPVAQGGNITSYEWSPSQFLSCTTCANPVASPQYTTQYILTVKNETSCTDTALVIVRTHTADGVYIPDAFTPNSDGLNDVFYVLGGTDVTAVKSFLIYNRWGQKVFESQNSLPNTPAAGWNGKVAGREVETGTYVYAINIHFANGTEKLFKGTVILIK